MLLFAFVGLLVVYCFCDHTCFDIPSTSNLTCSSHGICSSFNHCNCESGYYGFSCQLTNATKEVKFNEIILMTSLIPGTWEMHKKYCLSLGAQEFYEEMQFVIGIYYNPFSTESVITTGSLYSKTYTNWRSGYPNANYHYMVTLSASKQGYSDKWGHVSIYDSENKCVCSIYKCYGLYGNNTNVCNGHGKCIFPDSCECSKGYAGSNCSEVVGQTTEWSFESKVIYVTNLTSTYYEAQTACETGGGSLFVAQTVEEETAVGRQFSKYGYSKLWIGLMGNSTTNVLLYPQNTTFSNFTNWGEGFPLRSGLRGIAINLFEQSSDGETPRTRWIDEPLHIDFYKGLCIK